MESDEIRDRLNPAATLEANLSDRSNLSTVLRLYIILGIVVAVVAAAYFALTLLDFRLSFVQLVSVATAGFGILLSLMSWLLLEYRERQSLREKEKISEYANLFELVDTWSSFENVARAAVVGAEDDVSRYSLRSLISKLAQEGRVSIGDVSVLQEALEMRNMVVHGQVRFPAYKVRDVTNALAEIVAKISRRQGQIAQASF